MNCSFPRAQNVTSFHCAIKNNSDELTNTKTVYPTFDSHVYQFHRNQIQSIWYTRLGKYIRKIYISVYVAFAWHWDNFEPNNDPKNVFICIIPPTHGTGRLTPHHSWSSEKIECPTDDVFPSYYIGVRKKNNFLSLWREATPATQPASHRNLYEIFCALKNVIRNQQQNLFSERWLQTAQRR